jgi:HipA-like protein
VAVRRSKRSPQTTPKPNRVGRVVIGQPTRARSLAVWMNGERLGTWSLPAQGAQEFSYDDSWLRSSQFRPLSLSLPAGFWAPTLTGSAVESWFDNLLPWLKNASSSTSATASW